MKWLINILENYEVKYIDNIVNDIQKELPKYYIPKNVFNKRCNQLKEAKKQLKQNNKQYNVKITSIEIRKE
jgi:hypothetical protein